MNRFASFHRRLETAVAPLVAVVEKCSRPRIALASALMVSLVWLTLILVVKIRMIGTGVLTSDMPYYENMLYNTGFSLSHGSFDVLFTWHDAMSYNSPTFLTEHFSPTFALVAPGYWLIPHPIFLSVLQPLLIAIAGWGLYRLTQRLLVKAGISPAFGLLPVLFLTVYLFNYSNISATIDTIYGFHHDSLIPPLIAWMVVCAVELRWRAAFWLFVLFLGMKENLPIIATSALGLCFLFNHLVPRKRAALGLLLCGVFFAGCLLFEFRTHNRHVGIVYQFLDGDAIAVAMNRTEKWEILNRLWPALLTPVFAAPALADWCLQLMGNTTELDWHSYPLMLLAQIALVFTCVNLLSFLKWSRFLSLAVCAALVGWIAGPMVVEGGQAYGLLRTAAFRLTPLVDLAALHRISGSIPKDAKLSMTSDLLAFLADRRKLLWPESVIYANFVLINRRLDQENQRRADEFLQSKPAGNLAADHFYKEVGLVLRGYGYDTALVAYVDRLRGEGAVTLLKSEGKLELYQIHAPLPFSLP